MSIKDDAERLRQIASGDDIPVALLREAQNRLNGITGRVNEILGSDSTGAGQIIGMIGQATMALETALAAAMQVETTIHDVADYHSRG